MIQYEKEDRGAMLHLVGMNYNKLKNKVVCNTIWKNTM